MHDSFNILKKDKELADTSEQKHFNILYDKEKIVTELDQKLEIWKKFSMIRGDNKFWKEVESWV